MGKVELSEWKQSTQYKAMAGHPLTEAMILGIAPLGTASQRRHQVEDTNMSGCRRGFFLYSLSVYDLGNFCSKRSNTSSCIHYSSSHVTE